MAVALLGSAIRMSNRVLTEALRLACGRVRVALAWLWTGIGTSRMRPRRLRVSRVTRKRYMPRMHTFHNGWRVLTAGARHWRGVHGALHVRAVGKPRAPLGRRASVSCGGRRANSRVARS